MKILRTILLLIFSHVSLFAQDHQEWSYNLAIYEVNVRQYTSSGTFTEFGTHLDRLKELGVGILWFMPVHPIGVQNRLGSLGSYYSVKDYLDVNPEFGTMDDFKDLVDSIHAKGMYVLIDWVGNHTSWDNNLTVSHPEWYIKNGSGNFIPPPGTNWSDVIQLDYSKQELREYMIDALKFWVTEVGVDGFRCDAVSFMPLDFWTTANAELKSIKPEIFMIAEDDGTQYQNAGFDMSYGWGLYGFGNGILINIAEGTNSAFFVNTYNTQENNNYPPPHYRMYFTSNHDENSWEGTVYELFGDASEVFAVLVSTFRSMPLIYGGQEAGLNRRLAFFDKDQINWRPDPFNEIYKTLFHLKRENKALWNGAAGGQLQRVLTSDNASIFAFVREKDGNKVFAILNLTDDERTFVFQGNLYIGMYRDAFIGDTVSFAESEEITLPAWGYQLYEIGSGITSVEDDEMIVEDFFLSQNFPNPFNPSTTIQFSLPKEAFVTLKIYDLLGREIATVINAEMSAGNYIKDFNAANLSSGIYFYTLNADGLSQTKKLLLIK